MPLKHHVLSPILKGKLDLQKKNAARFRRIRLSYKHVYRKSCTEDDETGQEHDPVDAP